MDEFLRRMGELFEVVVFTASLAKVPSVVPCRSFSQTDLECFSMRILSWIV